MAYNKHQKLNDNIEAIRIALEVERDGRSTTAEELAVLRKYSGFGGLKFILNPVYDINLQDDSVWKSGDRPFLNDTIRLHELLQQFSKNDKEYQAYVDSLKRSVTTAFYTPDAVVKAISKTLVQSGIAVNKFLDPSSGNGKFIDAFKVDQPDMEVSAFEKDLLTGKILKALHPEDQVIVNGFETIPQEVLGSFDLVTSNIPFGDIKVFDPAMQDSDIRKFASNTLHNYFFLKARTIALRIMSIGMTSAAIMTQTSHVLGSSLLTLSTLPPKVTNTYCMAKMPNMTSRKFTFLNMPLNILICSVRALNPLKVIAIIKVAKIADLI